MSTTVIRLMSGFDKLCAVIAIPVGLIFIVQGVIGLFAGSSAHFTLPPVLGGLPFFLGWAMSVTLIRYWLTSNRLGDPSARRSPRTIENKVAAPDLIEVYEGATGDVHRLHAYLESWGLESVVVGSSFEGVMQQFVSAGSTGHARLAVLERRAQRALELIGNFEAGREPDSGTAGPG